MTAQFQAQAAPSDFPPLVLFFGGIALLHGLALVLNLWNYAGWWQLTQEQYRGQHLGLHVWYRVGWVCVVIGGGLVVAGLARLMA
jgi:hypothetical protein